VGILSKIFEKQDDDVIEAGATNPIVECNHIVLLPCYESSDVAADDDETLRFVCEACALEFVAGDDPVKSRHN
jgi:hypothetical protein